MSYFKVLKITCLVHGSIVLAIVAFKGRDTHMLRVHDIVVLADAAHIHSAVVVTCGAARKVALTCFLLAVGELTELGRIFAD
jgi:hypothetical protein